MTDKLRALEPTPMETTSWGGQQVAFRMDGYYYGFSETGLAVIDTILSAVACAGKAYHGTECWGDECSPYHDRLRGNSPSDWIQNAAIDAAKAIREALTPTPPAAEVVIDDDAVSRAMHAYMDEEIRVFGEVRTPNNGARREAMRIALTAALRPFTEEE